MNVPKGRALLFGQKGSVSMKKRPVAASPQASVDPGARSAAAVAVTKTIAHGPAMMSLSVEHMTLKLNARKGRIASLKVHGLEFLAAEGSEFCRFQTRNVTGAPRCLGDANAAAITLRKTRTNEIRARLCFDRQYFPSGHFEVELRIRALASGSLSCRLVFHNTTGEALEWIEVLGMSLKKDFVEEGGPARLFWPGQEGALVEGATTRKGSWMQNRPLSYPTPGWGGYYPGPTQMQFMAYTRGDRGLYIAAHDPGCNTKQIDYTITEHGVRPGFIHFCAAAGERRFALDYAMILTPFRGDWHDAAELYRKWVKATLPGLPPKTARNRRLPAWVLDAPLVVTYPLRGAGHHAGPLEPNEYAPPTRALPALRRLAEQLDTKLLVLLMHWEGTAPWSPPYGWPPLGGEADMRRFARELHKDGHQLGLYCSGTAWTQIASTGNNRYDRTDEFRRKRLGRFMCTGPRGEMYSAICNDDSIRWGYDICSATEFASEALTREAVKIAQAGVDYIQLFDQNLGCASHLCYSPNHGHPPGPGPWQGVSMNKLLRQITATLRRKKLPTVLGCEAAAAEPYIAELPVNDLRALINWEVGIPVPAYAYVYHEYTANFFGNQCGILDQLDEKKSPLNWHLRSAQAFISGDMLTAVLKSGGEITWGWCVKWDVAPPPQKSVMDFTRRLLQWRRGPASPFLVYGQMLKPFEIHGGATDPIHLRRGMSVRLPAIMTSRWRSPDGREAQVLANWTDRPQTGRLVMDRVREFSLARSDQSEPLVGRGREVPLALAPFSVAMVEYRGGKTGKP